MVRKRPSKTSRNVLNRIGRLDDVRLDCHTADPDGEVLDRLLAVSRHSWKHERGIAISSGRTRIASQSAASTF